MKVAILGTAPGWERAPWQDADWELWGLNDAYHLFAPDQVCTRWFELHGDTPLTRSRRPADHFERIAALDMPVYYLHGEPPTPTAIKLDVKRLASVGRDYFACTNAYQIALALSLGATEIALYGTPLQSNREVVVERPCVSYWLGLAEGRGVKVSVHHDNVVGLMSHPYRYALEDADERELTYWACESVRGSLDYWLPREAERLGIVETIDAA